MTIAALGIEASTKGVSSAVDQLTELSVAAAKAEAATGRLAPVTRKAGEAAEDLADAVGDATDSTRKLGEETRTTEGALSRLASRVGTAVGALAAMAGVALSINGYIRMADAWSDMRSQVGAATKDMEGAGVMMQRITDIANASYAPLNQTVQTYARNISVLRDLGINAKGAADFTESLNHMLVITATKGERAASVQNALTRAMALGRLQADGLETVLANGGRVAEALAEQLNTTVYGLRSLASEGKITGQVIADSLIKSLEEVREFAATMPATMGDAFVRIGTGVTALVGSFDQAFDISGRMAISLVAVGDALRDMAQTDFAAWADAATGALTSLAQIVIVLAASQLPALALALYAQAGAFSFATLAARAYSLALGAASLTGAALGRTVALMGGPIGVAASAMTLFGIAVFNTRRDSELLAETLTTTTKAQEGLNAATETYYQELSQQALDAMTMQATAAVDAVRRALKAAQEEFESANTSNNLLWLGIGESDRMVAAAAEVQRLSGSLLEAEARMSGVEHAASNFALRVREGTSEVVALTEAQDKALSTANDLTRSFENRTQLARTELQHGRESAQYLQTQINQERQIQFLKIASLDISNQQKAAARAAYDQMVMTEAATNGWNVKLTQVNTTLSSSYQALVKIRDTQPGSGWLSTGISKAADLALKLWDAVAANSALSNLSVSGPIDSGVGGEIGARGDPRMVAGASNTFDQPNFEMPSAGVGGGGAGGGTSGALQALITEISTERELLTVWYEEKLALVKSFTDLELEAVGGRHGALERIEAEHQERLRALGSGAQDQRLADTASFFGGMAELARSGGDRTLKIAQGFAAAQGIINSYLAFTEVLKDPSFVGRPLARIGAAAAALAQGLAAVRSIRGASAGGGGGGAGTGGRGAGGNQSTAPEAPLRVTLDTIDPSQMVSGASIIKLFESLQKEAGNRGIIWVPSGQ